MVAFVAARAKRRLSAQDASRLELAVEEWAVNVCRHAYAMSGGALAVSVWEEGERLLVEISDGGRLFDPTSFEGPDVTGPLAERTEGGLGVLLIRRMLEDVRYRREGDRNVVTFAVTRRPHS